MALANATDLAAGRFITSVAQTSTVYVTGDTYDPHEAAAELLEEWAARVARRHDFTADGATHARSQQRAGLLEAARAQRALARVRTVDASRGDVNAAPGSHVGGFDHWGRY